ncbi:hypothetical protein Lfu02_21090 [Longispora fulva]|uniref:Uncharacterized protein n=1 Tax=Longispora fulva TaxID=619741 RepID=A0A8J7GFR9_9ACTN|nr:hypothetical protein [Longispora fulva]MBG6139878.1 hypothetical protein [Longispora fulva]GIG57737.1 hypothetical protein Lfu02_21090 [Longispora fulva]
MLEGSPPEEYVDFVSTYAGPLRQAATAFVGHDQQTEQALREALGDLATRWRKLAEGRRLPFVTHRLEQNLQEWREDPHGAHLTITPDGDTVQIGLRGRAFVQPPAELAAAAWAGAGAIRRRRFLIGGGAVALAGLFAVSSRVSLTPAPESTIEPPPTSLPKLVQFAPEPAVLSGLPRRSTGLPAQLTPPVSAPTLAGRPTPRALAIVGNSEGVYALGADGEYRLLQDLDPSIPGWVQPSSLSADGTRAAFGQRGVIFIADMPTGTVRRFEVGGYHGQLTWLPDGRLLSAGGARSRVFDVATVSVRPVAYDVESVAVGSGPDLVVLDPTIAGRAPTVSVWPASATDAEPAGPADGPLPTGAPRQVRAIAVGDDLKWIGYWDGTAWLRGDLIVRGCNAGSMRVPVKKGYGTPQFATVVVDLAGKVRGALVQQILNTSIPSAPVVLGWLDNATVLVRLGDPTYRPLVAWDVNTKALSLVSTLPAEDRVSLPSFS